MSLSPSWYEICIHPSFSKVWKGVSNRREIIRSLGKELREKGLKKRHKTEAAAKRMLERADIDKTYLYVSEVASLDFFS